MKYSPWSCNHSAFTALETRPRERREVRIRYVSLQSVMGVATRLKVELKHHILVDFYGEGFLTWTGTAELSCGTDVGKH